METILTVVHLFLAIGLVGLILMQHGKGADAGAAFGSGASATVFGAQGASNFLSRTTGILAALFFMTSLSLGYFAMQTSTPVSLMDNTEVAPPATPVQKTSDLPDIPGLDATPATDMTNENDVPVVVPAADKNRAASSDVPVVPVEPATETAPAADKPAVVNDAEK